MNTNVLNVIKTVLPFIGTALGGPLGTGVAEFVSSKLGVSTEVVTDTLTSMVGNPEQLSKVKEIESEYRLHVLDLGYKSLLDIETLNASVVMKVNDTMQTEAASEHWVSYSWRPYIGFSLGTYITSIWILPLFHIVPVILSVDLVACIAGILGIASYFRGKAQADPSVPTKLMTNNG